MSTAQDRLRKLRAVAQRADGMQTKAEDLGKKAATALSRGRRSQVTGLESAANSAMKATDVLDYIKLRTARQHKDEWTQGNWGPELLGYLSKDLKEVRATICTELALDKDGPDGVEVYVMLIREFVRQFSAEYEYQCKLLELPKARPR